MKDDYRSFAALSFENPSPVFRVNCEGEVLIANLPAQKLIAYAAMNASTEEQAVWTKLIRLAAALTQEEDFELCLDGRYYQFTLVPVPAEEYCNLYGKDVTKRVNANLRVEAIAETLPGAVFEYAVYEDGSDAIFYMSQGAKDIWGIEPEAIKNDPSHLWQMIVGEDLAGMQQSILVSMQTLSIWTHEWRICMPDGRIKWLRGKGKPWRGKNNSVHWNTIVLDISNEKHYDEALSKVYSKTISALAAVVEKRDPYTAGHEHRVAELCHAIGIKLGLSTNRLMGLDFAARVHDIGKIKVPAEILAKPSKLNDAEKALVNMHPEVGADILKDIDFDWPIAEIVRQHHERCDGSGYPHSLLAKDILLEAKILCVADVFESMANHRPYRPALGVEAAINELKAGRGIQYDEQVVDAMLFLVENNMTDKL